MYSKGGTVEAGSVPSDFSDVSIDKYRYLAHACAPRPGDE